MAYGDSKDLTRRTTSAELCAIKHLLLLKIRNMMDIRMELLQCSINSLIKKLPVEQFQMKICQTKS